jgi:F-type H+-transporting ATPase subunit alpha
MTKQVAGKIKGELAQFRELAAFAQFGSDLDARTRAQLDRGSRIVELFKQPAFNPLAIEVQAAVLWAMQNNYFDTIDVKKIVAAAQHLREFLGTRKQALLDSLRQKAAVDEMLAAELKKTIEEWKGTYNG